MEESEIAAHVIAPTLAGIRGRFRSDEPLRTPEVSGRSAAVATILRESSLGPEVLLIRRSHREGDPWSGQMAFPGGRRDPEDASLLDTAQRETAEEIGLHLPETAELLGPLAPIEAVARGKRVGMTIQPFVFALTHLPPPFEPNHEVAEVIWAPIAPMLRGEVDATHTYVHEGKPYPFPAFDVRGRIVWGLTHRMLKQFFERLAG